MKEEGCLACESGYYDYSLDCVCCLNPNSVYYGEPRNKTDGHLCPCYENREDNTEDLFFLVSVREDTTKHIVVKARNEDEAESLAEQLLTSGVIDMEKDIEFSASVAAHNIATTKDKENYVTFSEADLRSV